MPPRRWKITAWVAGSAMRAANEISSPAIPRGAPLPSHRSIACVSASPTSAPRRSRSAIWVATSQIARKIAFPSAPAVAARAR